jgi:hypothetical protein
MTAVDEKKPTPHNGNPFARWGWSKDAQDTEEKVEVDEKSDGHSSNVDTKVEPELQPVPFSAMFRCAFNSCRLHRHRPHLQSGTPLSLSSSSTLSA